MRRVLISILGAAFFVCGAIHAQDVGSDSQTLEQVQPLNPAPQNPPTPPAAQNPQAPAVEISGQAATPPASPSAETKAAPMTDEEKRAEAEFEKLAPSAKVGALNKRIEEGLKKLEELEKEKGADDPAVKAHKAKIESWRGNREQILDSGVRVRGKDLKKARRDRMRQREAAEGEPSSEDEE